MLSFWALCMACYFLHCNPMGEREAWNKNFFISKLTSQLNVKWDRRNNQPQQPSPAWGPSRYVDLNSQKCGDGWDFWELTSIHLEGAKDWETWDRANKQNFSEKMKTGYCHLLILNHTELKPKPSSFFLQTKNTRLCWAQPKKEGRTLWKLVLQNFFQSTYCL